MQDDDLDPFREWPSARDRDVAVTSGAARLKRLAVALAIPVAVLLVMLRLLAGQEESRAVEPLDSVAVTTSPSRGTFPKPTSTDDGFRSYALEVTELDGLPPDAAPGTVLEVWVTWEPPLTRRIKVQKLVPTARLEKIIPNIVPEAPATALLSVPKGAVVDLMYGDRFGRLSVTLLPPAE